MVRVFDTDRGVRNKNPVRHLYACTQVYGEQTLCLWRTINPAQFPIDRVRAGHSNVGRSNSLAQPSAIPFRSGPCANDDQHRNNNVDWTISEFHMDCNDEYNQNLFYGIWSGDGGHGEPQRPFYKRSAMAGQLVSERRDIQAYTIVYRGLPILYCIALC